MSTKAGKTPERAPEPLTQAPDPEAIGRILSQAGRVAAKAQLAYVGLLKTAAELRPVDSTVPAEATHGSSSYVFNKPALSVYVELGINADVVHPVRKAQRFILSAVFEVGYVIAPDAEADRSGLEAFARVNGLFHAWPYWREYVQNTMPRFGLPGFVAPLLRAEQAASFFIGQPASAQKPPAPKGR